MSTMDNHLPLVAMRTGMWESQMVYQMRTVLSLGP